MSDSHFPIPTTAELRAWLRERPQTYAWDVLLAYDRVQCNRLLMQDYLLRFNTGAPLPAVTQLHEHEEGSHWEYIHGLQLDAPRLSFENSSLGSANATLTLGVVDGLQLTVEQPPQHARRLAKVEVFDALQGPKLVGTISLSGAEGVASGSGNVEFALGQVRDLQLTYADTHRMRVRGGRYFQQLFSGLSPERQHVVLSSLNSVPENALLDPGSGLVRVFNRQDATSPGAGDGAVVVFAHGKGTPPMTGPINQDGWVYPISTGMSASLLVSNHVLVCGLLDRAVRALVNEGTCIIEYDNPTHPSAPAGALHVTEGVVRHDRELSPFLEFDACRVCFNLPLNSPDYLAPGLFKVVLQDDRLVVEWNGSTGGRWGGVEAFFDVMAKDNAFFPESMRVWFSASWTLKRVYWLSTLENATLAWREDTDERVHDVTHRLLSWSTDLGRDLAEQCFEPVVSHVLDGLEAVFSGVLGCIDEVEAFLHTGAVFGGTDRLKPRRTHCPMDLLVLGDLAPREPAFAVSPQDVRLCVGGQARFTAPEGARWTLTGSGEDEATWGSIDQKGLYTAPSTDQMHGQAGRQVVINATFASHTSSAVARVVTREIACNPHVVVVGMGGQKVKFSAAALAGGAVQWELASRSGGRLEEIPLDHPVPYEPGDHFYISGPVIEPPGEPTPDSFIAVDEVVVTHASTQTSQTSYVVTLLRATLGEVRPVAGSMTPTEVQLVFLAGAPEPVEGVQWSIVLGSGAIDATGLYTADPDAPLKFAVIQGYRNLEIPGVPVFCSYTLLTVPLVDLEALPVAPVPEH